MLILFDNGTPRGLARFLTGHTVEEARLHGWEELTNGALIDAAERAGFELIITTDKKIALIFLENSRWPMVKLVTANIVAAVNAATPGSYADVEIPYK